MLILLKYMDYVLPTLLQDYINIWLVYFVPKKIFFFFKNKYFLKDFERISKSRDQCTIGYFELGCTYIYLNFEEINMTLIYMI